ncbi:phage major capsid protein [Hymenobacter negativus]|uniref:Phage major capsid protein n=1 Tax=Hymenobacter negativus TaxID=2795026 RepID=A0ABS0Q8I0_9BACT|nr:phage major capsid protein [Hymenobacter negativus]MBH8558988.1 phage major capsid protein [Hymenobacter negativus]
MKKLQQLLEERATKLKANQALMDAADADNHRDLSDAEAKSFDANTEEIRALDEKITRARAAEEQRATLAGQNGTRHDNGLSNQENRDLGSYSMLEAVRMANGNVAMTGLYKEMHEEAQREAHRSNISVSPKGVMIPGLVLEHRSTEQRAVTATGGANGNQGGVAIATSLGSFIDQLRNALVLAGLGADFMYNLVGNLDFPVEDSVFAPTWLTENATAQASNPTFKKLSMMPKRVAGFLDVSDRMLLQTSPSIEARLRGQLLRGMSESIDRAGLMGSGSGEEPTGVLNTAGIGDVAIGANGGAATFDHVVKLKGKVDANNALLGSLGYATNTDVRTQLQLTKKDAGSGIFVWGDDDNRLGGYKAGVTNILPNTLVKGTANTCSPLVFGNWNDLYIGMWSGIEILPDPYTQAANGMVRMHVKSFVDVLVARAKSFAAVKDILGANN